MNLGFLLGNSARLSCIFVKRNAPKILTITSAVTAIGACVGTGIATWNSKELIELHNDDIHILHNKLKESKSEEDRAKLKKDIVKEYGKTTACIAKNYSIPMIFLAASVASGFASNSISQARIAALGASYAVLKEVYEKYRKNVVDKYGEEVDADLAYGYSLKDVEVIDDKGKKKIEKAKEYDETNILKQNPCALLLGDGIECNLTNDYFDNITLINSAINYMSYKVLANELVTAYDFYCGEHGLGLKLRKDDKELIKTLSSYRFTKDSILLRIDNAKKSLKNRHDLTPSQKEEYYDSASRIEIGLHNKLNKKFHSRLEPTIWIIPDVVPIDYEDNYIPEPEDWKVIEF